MLEQSLNNLLLQRQNFSTQLTEVQSALEQLKGKQKAYKIIGSVMVEQPAPQLSKELQRKSEILQIRIKNLKKQEEDLQQKAKRIRESIMKNMKK